MPPRSEWWHQRASCLFSPRIELSSVTIHIFHHLGCVNLAMASHCLKLVNSSLIIAGEGRKPINLAFLLFLSRALTGFAGQTKNCSPLPPTSHAYRFWLHMVGPKTPMTIWQWNLNLRSRNMLWAVAKVGIVEPVPGCKFSQPWLHVCPSKLISEKKMAQEILFPFHRHQGVRSPTPRSLSACTLATHSISLFHFQPATHQLTLPLWSSRVVACTLREIMLTTAVLLRCVYRDSLNCALQVWWNLFLLLLNCSAWPCLGPS